MKNYIDHDGGFCEDYYFIVTSKCTECKGFHDEPQCDSTLLSIDAKFILGEILFTVKAKSFLVKNNFKQKQKMV